MVEHYSGQQNEKLRCPIDFCMPSRRTHSVAVDHGQGNSTAPKT